MAIKYNSNTSSEDDVSRKEMTCLKQNTDGNDTFSCDSDEELRDNMGEKNLPCSELLVHHSGEDKEASFHSGKTISCQDEKCKICETNKRILDMDKDKLKPEEPVRTDILQFFIIFYILKTFLDCLNFSSKKINYSVRKHGSSDSRSRTKWKKVDVKTNLKTLAEKMSEFFCSAESQKEMCAKYSKCIPCPSPYTIWRTIPATMATLYPVYDLHNYCQAVDDNPDISSEEQMKYEIVRYSSYKNFPIESQVLPMNLAKAGFYYTGTTDEVTCFSCKLKYKNWKAKDIPLEIHAILSPTCDFVKSHRDYLNILVSSTNNLLNGACGNDSDLLRNPTEGNRERLPENFHRETSREDNENIEIGRQSAGNDVMQNTTAGSLAIPNTASPQSHLAISELPQFQVANSRRPQYEQNISNTSQSGSVNSTLQHSEQNNTPVPQSELVNSARPQPQMNNTTLSQSQPVTSTPACSQNNHPAQTHCRAHSVLAPLGINFQRPKYQQYAVMATRLMSFRNWPKSSRQNPETMAKAGFIYEGSSDHTKCFFCGGGLREWEPNDDPWIEHAKWYPDCVYVQQCKGTKFIEEVQKGNIPEEVQTAANSFETEFRSHPAVISVLDMGYSEALIKRAVTKFCMKKDISDLRAEQLMDIVWDLEDTTSYLDTTEEVVEKETDLEITKTETKSPDKESVQRLLAENQQLKENQTCKICMDEETSIVFLPCGHMATCGNCAPAVRKCPICRTFIKGTVKAILS